MPVGSSKRVLNEMCSTRLCIDQYQDGAIQGRIYNNYFAEPICFTNLIQMIKIMEELFDSFEYPQQTIETRSFDKGAKKKVIGQAVLGQPVPQEKSGELGTFYVKVIFRKHATWQGSVLWVDAGKEENFRSLLELCLLLDSALNKSYCK